jgi:hypothetical protein
MIRLSVVPNIVLPRNSTLVLEKRFHEKVHGLVSQPQITPHPIALCFNGFNGMIGADMHVDRLVVLSHCFLERIFCRSAVSRWRHLYVERVQGSSHLNDSWILNTSIWGY